MAVKSKFTNEEWQLIKDGPEWIFAALAAADGNVAIMTKTKESRAFKKLQKDYETTSSLVNEVLGDKGKTSKEVKNATLSDAEQALEKINELLDAKLDRSEADQYRTFLNSVANSVADAAGEGAFGIGKNISKKEEKALAKIKDALKAKKVPKVEAKPVNSLCQLRLTRGFCLIWSSFTVPFSCMPWSVILSSSRTNSAVVLKGTLLIHVESTQVLKCFLPPITSIIASFTFPPHDGDRAGMGVNAVLHKLCNGFEWISL